MSACARCASALEEGELRCAICALPQGRRPDSAPVHPRVMILRCSECAAAVRFDAAALAPRCAFCSATMAIEQPQDPIEVASHTLAFEVDRDTAEAALRGWLGTRSWFAPRQLRDRAIVASVVPMRWAAWVVDASAEIAWAADSDQGARRSDWAPHAGTTRVDLKRICVPASRGLSHREAMRLVPYYSFRHALAAADIDAEAFDRRSVGREQVQRAFDATATAFVRPCVPGRRVRKLRVSSLVVRQHTDRFALPAWILAYRFNDVAYRAIVHGQRGDVVFGSSPVDPRRVAAVAVLAALVVAALAFAWWLR